MPKTKISEYSATNSSNTDIEGINIDEGCPPSSINNAIRELMVHLKEFQTGASGDAFTFAGGTLMSGTNTISGAAVISGNINSSGTTNTFSGGNILSGTNTFSGTNVFSSNVTLNAQSDLRFADSDSSNWVAFQSPATVASNVTWTLPSADGTSNQVLATNGSGTLSWATAGGGASISAGDSKVEVTDTGSNGTIVFNTDNAERTRITSGGDLCVGTTSSSNYRINVVSASGSVPCAKFLATSWGDGSNPAFLFDIGSDGVGLQVKASGNRDFPVLYVTNNAPTNVFQIYSNGRIFATGAYNETTASAANVFVESSGELKRSTSSLKYKTQVENIDSNYADAILNFRPVWYRSLCKNDNENWSWYGLIAEEVAEVEPRLVHWGYSEKDYEVIETQEEVQKERTIVGKDGIEIVETYTETETKKNKQLKADAQLKPEGVQYDRLTVLLLDIVKRQDKRIETLEAQNAAFEARLAALEAN